MGSVIDYIECPNCKHEAALDFYYKTGEEYTSCNYCGYHKSITIINRDKDLNKLTQEDFQVVELRNPYGSYRIKYEDSVAYLCGSLENEDHLQKLKEHIQTQQAENIIIESVEMSQYINGEIIKTQLLCRDYF
jgi:Zn ribbon nucleic-acid-binding protein